MKLPNLQIGDLIAKIPIIQGGMGIGVSGYKLASSVANEGGIGVISAVQIGYREPDFKIDTKNANIRALKKEIRKARKLSPKGIIGVNIMVAVNYYDDMIKAILEEDVDLIISGAGLPMSLPKLVEGSNIKIAPIVSSAKAVAIIIKYWLKKYNRLPDLVVVEGPEAGGHLGFNYNQINNKEYKLENITIDVLKTIKYYENKYNKVIPIVAAGGIYTGKDIAQFIKLGASGVQMASRFVATNECDANIEFKNMYVNAKKEEMIIVKSPVGLLGRAIKNTFIEDIKNKKMPPEKCYNCLKKCNPKDTLYCISNALINAVNGNVDKGLIFASSNVHKIDKILSVKELMKELILESEKYL
ncbi:nitronate monooxygenase [Clostridium acetireducens DSM 10703]|jgi:nitronate monooxygenase|uniref:Probable nitronate monooxygenase n=1 Tax=Clostridium acetireducens DSM 10703 TaxID=1121290 RepID=A0A1E8EV69_9CLOT|nr:nitronate monooxygenase family protein [Clostridium acetireducens]OFH96898.1 nitronate monooxygenase [Clostridium acetireducens DSM 10703]